MSAPENPSSRPLPMRSAWSRLGVRLETTESLTRLWQFARGAFKLIESRQALLVWCLWAVLAVWLGSVVARYGHNIPACDEWKHVAFTYAPWPERIEWVFTRHNEHFFVLARAVLLGLFDATGHDYRAGMWLTVGLLAASSAALILAARQLRGRTAIADIAFPLLFLNQGHTENLLMGYQIVFTITVFALASFLLAVAHARTAASAKVLLGAVVLLAAIALGGWAGLVFVPTIGLWIAWQFEKSSEVGSASRMSIVFGLSIAAIQLAISSWFLFERLQRDTAEVAPSLSTRVHSILDVLAMALGPGLGDRSQLLARGGILLAAQVVFGCILVMNGWRQPKERAVAWGLLAVLLGVWLFALSIGMSRGSGYASRYGPFAAFGVAIPLLVLAKRPRGTASSALIALLVLAGAYCFVPSSVLHARYQGLFLSERYQQVLDDVKTGMPIDVLAERHVDFWKMTDESWMALWENRFPLVSALPGPRVKKTVPLRFASDGASRDPLGTFNRYRVEIAGTMMVSSIRITFLPKAEIVWEPLRFRWVDPQTFQKHESAVYPWLCLDERKTSFWVDGPISTGELLVGQEKCPIDILEVEAVLK